MNCSLIKTLEGYLMYCPSFPNNTFDVSSITWLLVLIFICLIIRVSFLFRFTRNIISNFRGVDYSTFEMSSV